MANSLMAQNVAFSYRALSFAEFLHEYKTQYQALSEGNRPKARLFELTLPWLAATEAFMRTENSQVLVHCLYQTDKAQEAILSIAWPLVHNQADKKITSLSSFYSAVAEPIFFTPADKQTLAQLFSYIEQHHQWHSMQLGAFEEGGVAQVLLESFPYQRVYAKTDNIYQESINDYASYYQQRPSQLRNTIKRRTKKLAKGHQYRTEIITELDAFPLAFSAYKTIYQQSWKGDEFSFDFIEQVCLAALAENKLRLGLLFVDDEPAAAQLWFLQSSPNNEGVMQTTASIFKLAYSPKYQDYSVGSILSLALSEHVISQDQVSCIEFGMGSEPYKQDWLTAKRIRKSYQVFNPSSLYGKLTIVRYLILPRLIKLFTRKSK